MSSTGYFAISSANSSFPSSSAEVGTAVRTVVGCGSPVIKERAPITSPRRSLPTRRPSANTERDLASSVSTFAASSLASPSMITSILRLGWPSPAMTVPAGKSRKRIDDATMTSSAGAKPLEQRHALERRDRNGHALEGGRRPVHLSAPAGSRSTPAASATRSGLPDASSGSSSTTEIAYGSL